MNQILKNKIKFLKENPDKIRDYAGYIHNGMWRACRKCRGKGVQENIVGRDIVATFCSCVYKNLKNEIENIDGSNNT